MNKWFDAALDYIPDWIDYQMRLTEQPGCVVAIAHKGKIVLERAWGHADAVRGTKLTPRHQFRVASHSKSFTAAGIMKLVEGGKLQLENTAGEYVQGLHPSVAKATIEQLISNTAGIIRDGEDASHWTGDKPFLNIDELKADLAEPQPIDANLRMKYSNHGFGLAGLVIEAVTGESYNAWIKREVVDELGLAETRPDAPSPKGAPLAKAHSLKVPLGRRVIIPSNASTHALSPATGFVSTARDLALFFNQLSPGAKSSVISVASRREMTRRHWKVPHSLLERWYGLGTISGSVGGWDYFGHNGAFPGFITRTATIPANDLTISCMTNAADGMAHQILDGCLHVMRHFKQRGAPARRLADWSGRWWSPGGCFDLVPMGDRVLIASPSFPDPFMDASEIEITGIDKGRVVEASGFAHYGEAAHLIRSRKGGAVTELYVTGYRLRKEASVRKELEDRYRG